MIKAVAVAIIKNNKVLIAQRPDNKKFPLLWEFPGGKLEKNETLSQCAIRELKEELDIDIKLNNLLDCNKLLEESNSIKMYLFTATTENKKPKLLSHKNIIWVNSEEISNFKFSPIFFPFIKTIKDILK